MMGTKCFVCRVTCQLVDKHRIKKDIATPSTATPLPLWRKATHPPTHPHTKLAQSRKPTVPRCDTAFLLQQEHRAISQSDLQLTWCIILHEPVKLFGCHSSGSENGASVISFSLRFLILHRIKLSLLFDSVLLCLREHCPCPVAP